MSSTKTEYVTIHGRVGTELMVEGRSPNEYIAGIVYGAPKITTVMVEEHFVALCEYDGPGAPHTFERMASFSYGSQYMLDRTEALKEFGCWTYHYATALQPALPHA